MLRVLRTIVLAVGAVVSAGAAAVLVIAVAKNKITPEQHEKLLWTPLVERRGQLTLELAKIRAKKADKERQTLQETVVIAMITLFDLLTSPDQHYKHLWNEAQREQPVKVEGSPDDTPAQTLPM